MNATLAGARTFLFVPGHRPDRFAKAQAAGPDAIILDLEDAVAPADKEAARDHVSAWLADGNEAVVRINAVGTPWHEADVEAVAGRVSAVMVPKAEDPAALRALRSAGLELIPLIETALGVTQAAAVCAGVVRPAFGSIDLATQLGVDARSHEALRQARSTVVLAAAAAGCGAPIDGVTTSLKDEAALVADLRHAAELGFTAKLCIHPSQLAAAAEAFTPTAEQIEWARAVLAAGADGAATAVAGEMVDKPVIRRAESILSRA